MNEPSIGIITQARMTSTRLPGKILKSVGGKTLLQYHIDRLRWSGIPILIATTTNQTDDLIEDFAVKENLNFYRGSEEDVLSRYYHCAKKHKLDVVIRVTSDCPLIDGNIIKQAVQEYLELNNSNVYFSNCLERTFPRGFDFEIFSFQLLEEAFNHAQASNEKEHVTPYINQNKSGKVLLKHFKLENPKEDIRITVDTPEDFTLIKVLIEEKGAGALSGMGIISIFDQFPDLKKINHHIEQKKV